MDQALLNFKNYFEGVHNLLVNKERNQTPNWAFKSVDEISPEVIEYFFNYPVKYELDLPKDVKTRL
jgi:hypothetical protein